MGDRVLRWRTVALAASLLFSCISSVYGETPARTLSVGIVPQQSPGELARLWTPVLQYLERKSGLVLQLETAKDIATFDKRLMAGEYDIVYANPLVYATLLHSQLGYAAFAREKDRILVGLLVVRKDSRFQTLADLAGSDLAFPAEAAMAASVIPRAYMKTQGIAFAPHYVGSHDSVYLAVAKGLYAAGGGVARTLEMLPVPLKEQLRTLWTTPGYPPHPIAAHRRVTGDAVQRLQAAMIAMDRDAAGQAALRPLAFTGFVPARDADYDGLRSLGLKASGH
jgi:phosphonate transport system substrate-binding protein